MPLRSENVLSVETKLRLFATCPDAFYLKLELRVARLLQQVQVHLYKWNFYRCWFCNTSVCLCATKGSKTVSNHFESVSVQMMTISNHLQQDSKLTTLESLDSVLNLNKPRIFQVSHLGKFSLLGSLDRALSFPGSSLFMSQ